MNKLAIINNFAARNRRNGVCLVSLEICDIIMENMKPLILISNDDGVISKGMSALIRFLRPLGDIVVMAPNSPRSGVGCAVSMNEPVQYQLTRKDVGLSVYRCSGTPVDCIKLAFYTVLDRQPDIIVGGINHGDNSSVNVHYSGTMGAVIEGAIRGIPSVAFSLCDHDPDADFEPSGPYVRDIVEKVLAKGLPALTCLNVNFPAVKELKGVRICEQAKGVWVNEWENFARRGDSRFYWMAGEFQHIDTDNENSDRWALSNGYVAITPTTVDVTDRKLMNELKTWF